jgi:hypothetical protein
MVTVRGLEGWTVWRPQELVGSWTGAPGDGRALRKNPAALRVLSLYCRECAADADADMWTETHS